MTSVRDEEVMEGMEISLKDVQDGRRRKNAQPGEVTTTTPKRLDLSISRKASHVRNKTFLGYRPADRSVGLLSFVSRDMATSS
jgi:hypothetical protein